MAAITRREYSGNAAKTTLASGISNSDTSITVDDGTGYPTGTDPFFIVIERGTTAEEKILCSSRTGNTITVSSRGADDTSATSHDAGDTVEHVWTAQDSDDVNKVAAALTTKGDLLGFGTEPTRVPVGADDTIFVADSADAEGVAWKGVHSVLGTFEVDGSVEVDTKLSLTGSFQDAATVSLSIPAPWSGYKIIAQSTWTAEYSGDSAAFVRISIGGTAQNEQHIVLPDTGSAQAVPGAVGGRRTGMTATGSVDVNLQGQLITGALGLEDMFLYARAVRTS